MAEFIIGVKREIGERENPRTKMKSQVVREIWGIEVWFAIFKKVIKPAYSYGVRANYT